MDIDNKTAAVLTSLFLLGAMIGAGATYAQMDQRFESLENRLDNTNTVRIVHTNATTEGALANLFQKVDQSVVSVRGYGDKDAQGSGFIYSSDGYIVTNEHVIDEAQRVEVTFTEGETVRAEIVGMDVYSDLAVLKVNRRNLQPLELGNLSQVQVGQRAVAIGNPFGLPGTMTSGIVSQKGRTLPVKDGFSIPNVLQTDAAINPGNSGGPLMNSRGQVIGVNTAIETNTGTFSGVGFAIPVSAVKRNVPKIIDEGDVQHPWIGIAGRNVNSEIADEMNLEKSMGFLVLSVVEDSPADRAGLKAGNRTVEIQGQRINLGGDVIVAINDQKMSGINDILRYLSTREVDETVNITVVRDGERQDIPLTLGARSERQEEDAEE